MCALMLNRFHVQISSCLCRSRNRPHYLVLKRYRHKKKWATTRPEKTATDHALAYFDSFYKPVYGKLWPSMRVALLSQQKYSALLNNFCQTQDVIVDLITNGADDITKNAREKELPEGALEKKEVDTEPTLRATQQAIDEMKADMRAGEPTDLGLEPRSTLPGNVVGATGLYDFMPTKRVISEKEELIHQEIQQGFYANDDHLHIPVTPSPPLQIPAHLQLFAKPRGDVSLFPRPERDTSGKITYYLFDAASVLPVLALDLEPEDHVLDLCAAPGGKSLAILQTMLAGHLLCVDKSYSRLKRLKEVMKWYLPQSYTEDERVETIHGDGIHFAQQMKDRATFDKILVDVPCYTDRHVLLDDDNNLFQPGRKKERLLIQERQKNLLFYALQLLRPGGNLVYSTCTLAAPQNDGIVQSALEQIWETTNLNFVVKDTSEIKLRFDDVFNFYPNCRYGQLVIPNLTTNFGPMYFCKIQRTS